MFLLGKLDPYVIEIGNFRITWYAVFICAGAVIAYELSQYFAKKRNVEKEVLENFIYICFPIGILGARLWFVLSNLSMYQGAYWYHAFFIWEGGLAIQGGVVAGVISALVYLLTKWKKYNPLFILDLAVPNILIAQCLGRWGNFFNQEVYGSCIEPLAWLPDFIIVQMMGGGAIACPTNEMAQPLFLYESFLTFIGFILITFILRKYWTKYRPFGVLTGLYFVYYGIVRVCLEPLRNEMFIMRINGVSTSVVTSIVYIVAGVLFIGILYYYTYAKNRTLINKITTFFNKIASKIKNLFRKKDSKVEEKKEEKIEEHKDPE